MSKITEKLYDVHEVKKYCCSQSVFMAFADKFGIDDDTAARLSAAFGAGISHLGSTCGAVCGSAMVMGLYEADFDPQNQDDKHAFSDKVKAFGEKFEKEFGSLQCDWLREKNGDQWLPCCWEMVQWCVNELEKRYEGKED